jgi:hypothetical protein
MDQTGWHSIGGGLTDFSYSGQGGARSGISSLLVPGLGEFECLSLSHLGLWIQLSESTADALTSGVEMSLFCRRLGLGRVRLDHSTPLQPPAEHVLLQAVTGDAVLVVRRRSDVGEHAFLRVGRLADGARSLARTFGRIQVMLVVSDSFLPDPTWRGLNQMIAERRAFGGLVVSIEAG